MANDTTNTTGEKIDFHSILKRRKRTINNFITEFGVTSLAELDNVLTELGKEYHVSDDFRKLVISSLPPTPPPPATPTETLSDFVNNDVSNADDVQKPKKRLKKEV